ncbi:helix-turn-helix transcriptional regulator [Nocardioides humilatus]|uniref:Helix-turn-helix transcriptional regulator n=2 Tax=Nocardioides humilatus TaxID=2607660 RepID=A0A5B1LKH7_9ACTN|nr:helix-turn-helix transcriptional regulator [Nocardioides humilatus]
MQRVSREEPENKKCNDPWTDSSRLSRHVHAVSVERRPETAHRRAVGARIAQLRRERGWSQLELAGRADLHRPYVTGIESGTRNPSLDVFVRIANALHVPLWEVFKFEDRSRDL